MEPLTIRDAAIAKFSPKHTYAAWKRTASSNSVKAARVLRRTEKNKEYKRIERTQHKNNAIASLFEYASMPLLMPHGINFHAAFATMEQSTWELKDTTVYVSTDGQRCHGNGLQPKKPAKKIK